MLSTNDITARDADRADIASLTAAFIAKGGKVFCIPKGYKPAENPIIDKVKAVNTLKQRRASMMYQGQMMTQKEIARATGINWSTLRSRLKQGMTLQQAVDKVARKKVDYP